MKIKMLMPDYLKHFSCIGGECEDTCCHGFTIPIDKNTYINYQNVQEKPLNENLKKHINLNEERSSDADYGKLNASCGCPFQAEDGLCSIQKTLGERALSSACSKYPKRLNAFEKQIEQSATLSCPEIARLVLKNENRLKFEERLEEIDERDMVTLQITKDMIPLTKYFSELRTFTIQVLQERQLKLEKRLKILENFYKELSQGVEPLPLVEYYIEHLHNFNEADEIKINGDEIIKGIEAINEKISFVKRYQQTFDEVKKGLITFDSEPTYAFLKEHHYIIENYLVNYVFKSMFPISYGKDVYEAFKMLKTHFILIQFHLMCVGSYLGRMDMDIAVRVIQSWTKEAEHNSFYMERMYQIVVDSNQTHS